jgi:hypothetical protein
MRKNYVRNYKQLKKKKKIEHKEYIAESRKKLIIDKLANISFMRIAENKIICLYVKNGYKKKSNTDKTFDKIIQAKLSVIKFYT